MINKKVCLVGLGNIGMVHFDAYLKLGNIDLSVVDVNPEIKKIAKKHSLKYFSNLEDALGSDFDIIDICTPTFLHYAQIKLCLEKTMAVIFCEKPFTISFKEAKELLKISENKKRSIFCAMVERFNDPFVRIKEELNKIDGPYDILLTRRTKKPLEGSWYKKENSGGDIVCDLGVHDIDLSMYLTNEFIADLSIKNIGADKGKVIIDLKLSKGSKASINLLRDLPENDAVGIQNSCKVFYKNKELVSYESDSGILTINSADKKQIKVKERFPIAYYNEVQAVIHAVNGGKNIIFPSNKQLLSCAQALDRLNK